MKFLYLPTKAARKYVQTDVYLCVAMPADIIALAKF